MRGHSCRALQRKDFDTLPRNVPGFFHSPLRARLGTEPFRDVRSCRSRDRLQNL